MSEEVLKWSAPGESCGLSRSAEDIAKTPEVRFRYVMPPVPPVTNDMPTFLS